MMYQSNEAWPDLSKGETRSERIRYLDIFPYINKPTMLCDFNEMGEGAIIYHIFAPICCMLLLTLIIRSTRGSKKKKRVAGESFSKSAMHEEPKIIETRSDTDMFCLNCGNELPEDVVFCPGCGANTQAGDPGVCRVCGTKLPVGVVFCPDCGAKTQTGEPGVCTACGTKLPEGVAFCPGCGKAVNLSAPESAVTSQAVPSEPSQGSAGLVGFSDRCNHPEILAFAQKNKKYATGFMWILVFVPLVGFPVAGLLMDKFPFGQALITGVGISLVMLILNLLSLRKTRQPMWEGVVVNKYSKEEYEHRDGPETYTKYTIAINTDAGKKKTIVETGNRRKMYDYLSVGDRVRFHPKLGTYEKYDKSKDYIIYCNVCTTLNPIQNDRCKRCNNLLFK